MKIASISPINQNIISNRRNLANNAPIQSYASNKTKNTTYPKNYYTVNFTGLFTKKKKLYTPAFMDFIHKEGKVDEQEYLYTKLMSPHVIDEARRYIEENTKDTFLEHVTPEIITKYARAVKADLDENFGEDKYKLIAVGTSVSAIGEALSNLGVDVAYVPVSNIKTACYTAELQNIDDFDKIIEKFCPRVNTVIDYLIARNEIPNNKDIALFDFTSTGKTLKTLRIAMQNRLGDNFKGNIYQIPVSGVDYSINGEMSHDEFLNIIDSMSDSSICKLGNVPHFNVSSVTVDEEYENYFNNDELYNDIEHQFYSTDEELFKAFDNFSTPLARAFSLVCLDIINQEKSKA